jgi:kynurenine formamidase
LIGYIEWHDFRLKVDFSQGRSIAIPLQPDGPQPSFFAPSKARARPLQSGDYIGSVAHGGSCNADVLEFTPHCHGTHTECIAHLTRERGNVLELIDRAPCLTRLVSLTAADPKASDEHYAAASELGQPLLTLAELQALLAAGFTAPTVQALIVRTRPNGPDKLQRDYAQAPPYPVFSDAAMQWLAGQELKHLLVDTPSLDAAHDGGRLANHRCWWGLAGASPERAGRRSLTEMIYVPDDIADGLYWLHLGLQPLAADATASEPVIYAAQAAPA